jgi:Ribosome inactivating protein
MAGGLRALSTYRALRLGWVIREAPGAPGHVVYTGDPNSLLRFFRAWDGQIAGHHVRLNLCVLIFVVCEALRFRSIETACARWIRPIGGGVPDPAGLTITEAMLDTVQNWHDRASRGDPDIWTWPREMPDLIVT